jgi:hypothetical protein
VLYLCLLIDKTMSRIDDDQKELTEKLMQALLNKIASIENDAARQIHPLRVQYEMLKKSISGGTDEPSFLHELKEQYVGKPSTSHELTGREHLILKILKGTNQAMVFGRIKEEIESVGGPDAKKALKSLWYTLRELMVKKKKLLAVFKAGKNSNKHTYYVPVEFLDSKGRLKPEHMPSKDAWGNFTKDQMDLLLKKPWTIGK